MGLGWRESFTESGVPELQRKIQNIIQSTFYSRTLDKNLIQSGTDKLELLSDIKKYKYFFDISYLLKQDLDCLKK